MPENPIKIGFLSSYRVKMMSIPGAVTFLDLRHPKKNHISVQQKMSQKKGFFSGRIRGGERFGSEKGRWIRTYLPYIYIYINI